MESLNTHRHNPFFAGGINYTDTKMSATTTMIDKSGSFANDISYPNYLHLATGTPGAIDYYVLSKFKNTEILDWQKAVCPASKIYTLFNSCLFQNNELVADCSESKELVLTPYMEGKLTSICYPIHGGLSVFPLTFFKNESYYNIDFVKKKYKFPRSLPRLHDALLTRLTAFYRVDVMFGNRVIALATSIPI